MEGEAEPTAKKLKLDSSNNFETVDVVPSTEECPTNVILNENELKYGLKLFVNKTLQFNGIIKQRYSDFMVREADVDGNLVYLTDLKHCDSDLDEKKSKTVECPIDSKELWKQVEEFVKSKDKSGTLTLDPDNDKEHRKVVHKYIKDTYGGIETDTITLEDGSRAIALSFKSNRSGGQRKPGWPKELPAYCHFVLFKENRDTMECINVIARMLHIKAARFGYAGTKDRRATTIQRVSVQKVYSKHLTNLNKSLKNISLGNFSYKDNGLNLGELSGNAFTIIVRDVLESDARIDLCCSSMKEKGFINYFGLQRFGTGAVPTHVVGKTLLASSIEEAVNLILQVDKDENNIRLESAAKEIWQQTRNAKMAYAAVRSKSSIEGKLFEKLSRQQEEKYNFYNAFMALPRNNRLIYLHSYQSIVWNNMVSKRIEEFGFEPVVGDLVLNKQKDENGHLTVSTLTEIDIDLKTFDIFDIVLPLPGYDMVYPSNKMKQFYRDYLESDGLDIDNMKNKVKDLSLSGTYRNILVKPKEMSWEILRYDDYTICLIENDSQKLMSSVNGGNGKSTGSVCSQSGKHKAVKLMLTLPTSCYATTALRELLTADSSYKAQTSLNKIFLLK